VNFSFFFAPFHSYPLVKMMLLCLLLYLCLGKPLSFSSKTFSGTANENGLQGGDLNNDGLLDFVTTATFGPWILVWINNGTLTSPSLISPPTVVLPMASWADPALSYSIQLRDFSGDGLLDIVCGFRNSSGSGQFGLGVFVNLGNGGFSTPSQVIGLDNSALWLFSYNSFVGSDINNDTRVDLVAVGSNKTTQATVVALILNMGSNTFGGVTYQSSIGVNAISITSGKLFSAFGPEDLVVLNNLDCYVLGNNGAGSFLFSRRVGPTAQLQLLDVGVGDFNNDGFNDLAISGLSYYNIAVNTGATSFSLQSFSTPSQTGSRIFVADMNGDATVDLGIFFTGSSGIFWYLNTGVGPNLFFLLDSFITASGMRGSSLVDVNRDGRPDVAFVTASAISVATQVVLAGPLPSFTNWPPPLLGTDVCNYTSSSCGSYPSCSVTTFRQPCMVSLSTSNLCYLQVSTVLVPVSTSDCGASSIGLQGSKCGPVTGCNPFLCPNSDPLCCQKCSQSGSPITIAFSMCATCAAFQNNLNSGYTVRRGSLTGSVVYPNSFSIFIDQTTSGKVAFSIVNPSTAVFWSLPSANETDAVGISSYTGQSITGGSVSFLGQVYIFSIGTPPPKPVAGSAGSWLEPYFVGLALLLVLT
jgi:hypothetical protein